MQTWATFSTTDHRKPIYRQALALFDRIVVPVPSAPIGDQTAEELDQLEAEVEFLEHADAARRYEWDSKEYMAWRSPLMAEALARSVRRDAYMDTRIMLAKKMTTEGVEAVPVYGDMAAFGAVRDEMGLATWGTVNDTLTVEIARTLPVPDHDTALEDLVRLRESAAFQQAMKDLNEWKYVRIPAILLAPDHEGEIRRAVRDFNEMANKYTEAMKKQERSSLAKVFSIIVSVATADAVGAIKEGATWLNESRTPRWMELAERKYAPGGVVYQFQEAAH
ncbi:MAG TPA: hypothetical protein VF742_07905 [Terracidiphilus sp.]|jgi:hypothetical protein